MECPLCKHVGLGAEVENCPSCKADLTTFHSLDAIETSIKKQKKTTAIFVILFILALLGCVAIYLLKSPSSEPIVDKEKVAEYEITIQGLTNENQSLKASVASLQEEKTALEKEAVQPEAGSAAADPGSSTAEPEIITHVILEGESLFSIAKKYLGNGDLYPKIASDNGIDDPDIIIAGKEIIINK
jgi:cell division protein FtsB